MMRRDLKDHVKRVVNSYHTDHDINKGLEAAGMKKVPRKMKIQKTTEVIWGPGSMVDEIIDMDNDGKSKQANEKVRGLLVTIDALLADTPM